MDRFSIFWRYSESYPNFIFNQVERTIRLTLVGSSHRLFFFSSYPIWFLNLFKFKPVSRYRTFFPTLLITSTDFSDFYIEPFDSNVIGHFCCWLNFCCITFLCTSPGFHSRTGKLQVQEPTFPILEHCSCHARWSLTFVIEVITDEPIKQPM